MSTSPGNTTGTAQRDFSTAIYDRVVPARAPWSHVVKCGQVVRIIDTESQQAVDALFYNVHNFAERYSAQDTLRVQRSAYLSLGAELVSNEGRVMGRIVADTCGRHDTSAGCCSCESNAVRFGEATKYQHACRENFIYELGRHGMTKRDIVSNLMTLGFFLTPIIYLIDRIDSRFLRALLRLNPMTPFVVSFQDILFFGHLPGLADTLLMIAYAFLSVAAGLTVFDRLRDVLAEAI